MAWDDPATWAAWLVAAVEAGGLGFAIYKWRKAEMRAATAEQRQDKLVAAAQQYAAAQHRVAAVEENRLRHDRQMDLVDFILGLGD